MIEDMVYVVGTFKNDRLWSIEGVFTCREIAINKCTNANMFVGPVELDKLLPEGSNEWPGVFYPLSEK